MDTLGRGAIQIGNAGILLSDLSGNRHADRVGGAGYSSQSLAGLLASGFYHIAVDCFDSILLDIEFANGMVGFAMDDASHVLVCHAPFVADFEHLAAAEMGEGGYV